MFSLVHGGWSSWSDWTECPKTRGKAVRSRKRTCSNPEPKNNGRLCVGAEREEETCPEIICSGQTARLSAWTGKTIEVLVFLQKTKNPRWERLRIMLTECRRKI